MLASQRITYSQKIKEEKVLYEAILMNLDEAFGQERTFLRRDHAEIIGEPLRAHADKTGRDKNIILDEMRKLPGCTNIEKNNIYLIDDDNISYSENMKEHGYSFVHAPRADAKGSYEDRKHLAEKLIRTISPQQIFGQINQFAKAPEIAEELIATVKQFINLNATELPINYRLNFIDEGITTYQQLPRGLTSHLNIFSSIFARARGSIRGGVYQALLQDAETLSQKKIILFALFTTSKGETLQKHVYSAMGFSSVEEVRESLNKLIKNDLAKMDGEKELKEQIQNLNENIIFKIAENANNKKTYASDAYDEIISELKKLDPQKNESKRVALRQSET